jgi:hypothetical protein
MKVGDMVQPILGKEFPQELQLGIIVGWDGTEPVVFWNERFPAEMEYKEQIEVISESR